MKSRDSNTLFTECQWKMKRAGVHLVGLDINYKVFFSWAKKWWSIWNCWCMFLSYLFSEFLPFIDSFQACIWNQMVYSWTARQNILTFNVNALTFWAVGYSYIFLHDLDDKKGKKNPLFLFFFNAYKEILLGVTWSSDLDALKCKSQK